MDQAKSLAAPLGRVFIAIIFVVSGFGKLMGIGGTQQYMEAMGVPGVLVYPTIVLELLGGIAIIVGWQTRIVALALAAFTLVAALIFHNDLADQMQQIMFMKNLAITGGLLFLVAFGAGRLSIDNRG
ncbi:MAG: DoxX family protein [Flavobacteriaceae bacterium]